MPLNAMGRDKCGLHKKQQHPQRKDCAVYVKNGAGKRRAEHARLKVRRREANEDADAQQDRHAAKKISFEGAVDRPVHSLTGCRRKDRIGCHSFSPTYCRGMLRKLPEMSLPGCGKISRKAFIHNTSL